MTIGVAEVERLSSVSMAQCSNVEGWVSQAHVQRGQRCIRVSNFVEFGQTVAEISCLTFFEMIYSSCSLFLIFTARCTIVQSAVLLLHVVCLSVCDVGGS